MQTGNATKDCFFAKKVLASKYPKFGMVMMNPSAQRLLIF